MIVVYAKIGTGPGGYARLKYLRKPPEVGAKVEFKRTDCKGVSLTHGAKWETGLVERILAEGRDEPMYCIAFF